MGLPTVSLKAGMKPTKAQAKIAAQAATESSAHVKNRPFIAGALEQGKWNPKMVGPASPLTTMSVELKGKKPDLPPRLPRAAPKTKEEISTIAERMAPQLTGEFVRIDPKVSLNPAGKSLKQWELEQGLQHDIKYYREPLDMPVVDRAEHMGKVEVTLPGDASRADVDIFGVNDEPLARGPSRMYAGPRYGRGDRGWASEPETAIPYQRAITEASEQYGGVPVIANYMMMGKDSLDYALHFADANLKAIDISKMTPKQIEAFNSVISGGYDKPRKDKPPKEYRWNDFAGIENPTLAYRQMEVDPDLRKHFNAVMQIPKYTVPNNMPNGQLIKHAVLEPELRDLERGSTGYSMLEMQPEKRELPIGENPTYLLDIWGKPMGRSRVPIPYEITASDTVQSIRKNPKQAPQEFGTMIMGGSRQIIDQQHVDEIGQYLDRIKELTGKAEGGEVEEVDLTESDKKLHAMIDGHKFKHAMKSGGKVESKIEGDDPDARLHALIESRRKELRMASGGEAFKAAMKAGRTNEVPHFGIGGSSLREGLSAAKPVLKPALKIKPPTENIANVRDANFKHPKTIGNQTVKIDKLSGGVRLSDPNEQKRVKELARKIVSPDGYISRIIVDHNNNVIEGQHRLEALRLLGIEDVPVFKIEDLADTMPVSKMEEAVKQVGAIHPDQAGQLVRNAVEHIADDGMENARNVDYGRWQKHYDAALEAAIKEQPSLAVEAPQLMLPSKLSNVRNTVRQSKGAYGARRVERASDEVPNLESMYNEQALNEIFLGDNAKALMTMNPADFEKFAIQLKGKTSVGPNAQELAKMGNISKYSVPTNEYVKHLQRIAEFDSVPYLNLAKEEVGLPLLPYVTGHEGRHRSRALAGKGEKSNIVNVTPTMDLREGMPRSSQEEFIEALKKELELSQGLVLPQSEPSFGRPPIKLPDVYADGGTAHFGTGGASLKAGLKAAKPVLKGATKAVPAKEALFAKMPQMKAESVAKQALEAEYQKSMRNVPYDKQATFNDWNESRVLPLAERDANLAKMLESSAENRRMYHGSKEPYITEFRTRKDMTDPDNMTGHYADERDAVFLSPEPSFTTHFSKEGYTDTHQAPTTYPVYVDVKNPFDFDNPEHLKKVKETYLDMYHNPESEFYDPSLLGSERSTAQHLFNKRVDGLPEDQNNWGRIENPEFQQILKDIGFDSFYTRERGTKNLGVYEPSKIKSAIGNRGTYDTSDPDMNKAHGGIAHMKEGGDKLEAEYKELNKPAFYPRVGKIKNKNYKSPQPMPFADQDIENPELQRAMELPNVDVEVPTKENLEMSRRLAQRQADLEKQIQADRSPLDKFAGVIQGGRLAGSAMFQGINSIPTRLAHGDKAAEKFIQDRIYKPTNELGVEYAGDLGQFLEELETKYKIPPIATGEVLGFAPLITAGTAQAAKAAGKGTKQFAKALAETAGEKIMSGQPLIRGVPASITNPMMKSIIKLEGKGNWLNNLIDPSIQNLKRRGGTTPELINDFETHLERIRPDYDMSNPDHVREVREMENTIKELKANVVMDKWVDSNLTNYVKKQMGTMDDPVRKLGEEGISHLPADLRDITHMWTPEELAADRKLQGFPEEGVGKSTTAQLWEQMADQSIYPNEAGPIQKYPAQAQKRNEALAKLADYEATVDKKLRDKFLNAGIDEGVLNKFLENTHITQKAETVGEGDFARKLNESIPHYPVNQQFLEDAMSGNPWITKLDPKDKVYSGNIGGLGFDHILDVLREDITTGRVRPEQMSKVSMEQAVRRTHQYDQELAERMSSARAAARKDLPLHKEYPEQGYRWIQLTRPGDFAAESDAMGHSVRGYEPPVGHPDWVEGSGDTGRLSYGLGGWEGIKSGDAKVYSLVDAKGEPHSTIEVGRGMHPIGYSYKGDTVDFPDTFEYNRNFDEGFARPTKEQGSAIINRAQEIFKNNPLMGRMDAFQSAANDVLGELPGKVHQIKGKGNARPIEKYDPFTQDFVRSGNWSEVNELQNTGLINADVVKAAGWDMTGYDQKYLTKQEYEEIMRRHEGKSQPPIPPIEGEKRGGRIQHKRSGLMALTH